MMEKKSQPNEEELNEDFAYGWNGLRPNGERFGLDPLRFIVWAVMNHPGVYYDDTKLIQPWVMFTKEDAIGVGLPELEGTVAVTVDPPRTKSYTEAARLAVTSVEDPAQKEAFQKLLDAFEAEGL